MQLAAQPGARKSAAPARALAEGATPLARRQANQIKDARGREVPQLDPVAMHLLHRHDEGIPKDVLSVLTREIGFGKLADSPLGLIVGGVGFACATLLRGFAISDLIRGNISFSSFVQRSLWYQGIWAIPYAFWKAARRSRFNRIRHVMLDHLRCPHCAYDLRMLQPDPEDGATVCPECGAAWRLADVPHADDRVEG